MSDKLASRSFLDGLFAWFSLRRALTYTGMFLYCLALFLAFDFAWSSLTRGEEKARAARIANPVYDHGFAADFDGYDVWGELRYLLDIGLKFDEVVVFSDTSDVTDEATSYFCIDDDPKYRAHCTSAEGSASRWRLRRQCPCRKPRRHRRRATSSSIVS